MMAVPCAIPSHHRSPSSSILSQLNSHRLPDYPKTRRTPNPIQELSFFDLATAADLRQARDDFRILLPAGYTLRYPELAALPEFCPFHASEVMLHCLRIYVQSAQVFKVRVKQYLVKLKRLTSWVRTWLHDRNEKIQKVLTAWEQAEESQRHQLHQQIYKDCRCAQDRMRANIEAYVALRSSVSAKREVVLMLYWRRREAFRVAVSRWNHTLLALQRELHTQRVEYKRWPSLQSQELLSYAEAQVREHRLARPRFEFSPTQELLQELQHLLRSKDVFKPSVGSPRQGTDGNSSSPGLQALPQRVSPPLDLVGLSLTDHSSSPSPRAACERNNFVGGLSTSSHRAIVPNVITNALETVGSSASEGSGMSTCGGHISPHQVTGVLEDSPPLNSSGGSSCCSGRAWQSPGRKDEEQVKDSSRSNKGCNHHRHHHHLLPNSPSKLIHHNSNTHTSTTDGSLTSSPDSTAGSTKMTISQRRQKFQNPLTVETVVAANPNVSPNNKGSDCCCGRSDTGNGVVLPSVSNSSKQQSSQPSRVRRCKEPTVTVVVSPKANKSSFTSPSNSELKRRGRPLSSLKSMPSGLVRPPSPPPAAAARVGVSPPLSPTFVLSSASPRTTSGSSPEPSLLNHSSRSTAFSTSSSDDPSPPAFTHLLNVSCVTSLLGSSVNSTCSSANSSSGGGSSSVEVVTENHRNSSPKRRRSPSSRTTSYYHQPTRAFPLTMASTSTTATTTSGGGGFMEWMLFAVQAPPPPPLPTSMTTAANTGTSSSPRRQPPTQTSSLPLSSPSHGGGMNYHHPHHSSQLHHLPSTGGGSSPLPALAVTGLSLGGGLSGPSAAFSAATAGKKTAREQQ